MVLQTVNRHRMAAGLCILLLEGLELFAGGMDGEVGQIIVEAKEPVPAPVVHRVEHRPGKGVRALGVDQAKRVRTEPRVVEGADHR